MSVTNANDPGPGACTSAHNDRRAAKIPKLRREILPFDNKEQSRSQLRLAQDHQQKEEDRVAWSWHLRHEGESIWEESVQLEVPHVAEPELQ